MIHLIATGGTIAGLAEPGSGGTRYTAGVLPVEALLAGVPELPAISAEQVLWRDSKDMTPEDWLLIRAAAQRALARPEVTGLVILHGTDTLEESAFFLHLTLPAGKPVVLTGAMRPADHPHPDGPANLLAAVRLASRAEARAKGVLVLMNGSIHAARSLVKARTGGLDAFESGPNWTDARPDARFATAALSTLPRVNILSGYAGAPAELIDASVAGGARGLVLALPGHGSVAAAWLPALRRARAKGVAILRGSRCAGEVAHNANADDDAEGWLTAADLPPLKARILLMLALATQTPGTPLQL